MSTKLLITTVRKFWVAKTATLLRHEESIKSSYVPILMEFAMLEPH